MVILFAQRLVLLFVSSRTVLAVASVGGTSISGEADDQKRAFRVSQLLEGHHGINVTGFLSATTSDKGAVAPDSSSAPPDGGESALVPARTICILGGSFDPPTLAHTMIAKNVLELGYCDEMRLLPCGARPDKPSLKTPVQDRFRMTELAVAGEKEQGLTVSDMELHEPKALPTYEVWKRLTTNKQQAEEKFLFLIGSDLPPTIKYWGGNAQEVWDHVPFLVYEREGYPLSGGPDSGSGVSGGPGPGPMPLPKQAKIIQGGQRWREEGDLHVSSSEVRTSDVSSSEVRTSLQTSDVSSSEVRKLLGDRNQEAAKSLLAPGVWDYIVERGLYGVISTQETEVDHGLGGVISTQETELDHGLGRRGPIFKENHKLSELFHRLRGCFPGGCLGQLV